MTCSLLIARNLQQAEHATLVDWKWERAIEAFGRDEYRRPDRPREVIRWLPDRPNSLDGLRWNTTVYLVEGWRRRNDAGRVQHLLDSGFFREEDPELVAPRRRPSRDAALAEVRRQLAKLELRK